jgi:hypothetical protein
MSWDIVVNAASFNWKLIEAGKPLADITHKRSSAGEGLDEHRRQPRAKADPMDELILVELPRDHRRASPRR